MPERIQQRRTKGFLTAFGWSALGCIGLWTIGYVGWALQEDW